MRTASLGTPKSYQLQTLRIKSDAKEKFSEICLIYGLKECEKAPSLALFKIQINNTKEIEIKGILIII